MTTETLPLVLCVDDDRAVLDGFSRILRRDFELVLATGGAAGVAELHSGRPFAVVLSDMRMPAINGVAVLTAARKLAPEAVRIVLTGHADTASAAAAVNEGQIFRFLTKPCAPEVLRAVLFQGVEQHRLISGERVLLEQTLRGSVQALIEVLALTSPVAFGRAERARRLIGDLAQLIGFRDRWQMEMAAMLSQVGVVTLPPAVAERYATGAELSGTDARLVAELPGVALRLLGEIPRLDEIREILRHVNARYVPGHVDQPLAGDAIPLGARMLRAILDYDLLRSSGHSSSDAMNRLHAHTGWYDPALLSDLATVVGAETEGEIVELRFQDVKVGMVFVDDVRARDGTLLVARGQEVTASLIGRIENFWADLELPGPVRVTARVAAVPAGAA